MERTRTGDWNVEDFEAFLSNVYEVLTHKAQECRTLIDETNYRDDAPEEVDGGLRGIDLYEMGMQELWLFLHDGEAHHLEEGMRLIWEGNEKINDAMRLNRESREDLDVTFFL